MSVYDKPITELTVGEVMGLFTGYCFGVIALALLCAGAWMFIDWIRRRRDGRGQ